MRPAGRASGEPRRRPYGAGSRLPGLVGSARRCPSSTTRTRPCASTSTAWPSAGSASASTAGGSTCPRRSTSPVSGRSSGAAAWRSNPEAYLVGEIWNPAPEWLAGDRFDALMNYPLTEAILSFTGAGRLDEALVGTDPRVRPARPRRSTGRSSAGSSSRSWPPTRPAVTSLQLNLLDSHDTPRFISLAGGDATALRLATLIQMTLPGAPCIYYGDEVGPGGARGPGLPARLSLGSGPAGSQAARLHRRADRASRGRAGPAPRSIRAAGGRRFGGRLPDVRSRRFD